MAQARIALPSSARPGEVIEIKTLISHPMETGQRRDAMGREIPRNILTSFEARLQGRLVFRAELKTGVAANPYIAFFARVAESGTFEFVWSGDNGFLVRETREILVAG